MYRLPGGEPCKKPPVNVRPEAVDRLPGPSKRPRPGRATLPAVAPLFDPVAEGYRAFRPAYPTDLLDRVDGITGGGGAGLHLDVGCGTGILARQLAGRGLDVLGVDPSTPMLAQALRDGGGPRYLLGAAEALPLAPASVVRVTVAQALHWFDLAAFCGEVHRIAVPGAWACALWNRRVDRGLTGEYDRIMRRFTARYAAKRHGTPILEALRSTLAPRTIEKLAVEWVDRLDWEAFIGRARSTSYVHHGEGDRERLEADLRAAFDRHADGSGVVDFGYQAVAYLWRAHP